MDRVLAQVMPWRKGVVADLTAAVTVRLVVVAHRTAVVVHTAVVAAVHMPAVEDTAAASIAKHSSRITSQRIRSGGA
jgi:dTDP-4-dehydrorhamnose reductase